MLRSLAIQAEESTMHKYIFDNMQPPGLKYRLHTPGGGGGLLKLLVNDVICTAKKYCSTHCTLATSIPKEKVLRPKQTSL